VQEILAAEKVPENTLFCGDAGFVGYEFWKSILDSGGQFLVRVGANVHLLSEHADIEQLRDHQVLCWPRGKQADGEKPLRLRLVRVKIGKTKMWMLTSVLDKSALPKHKIIKYYKMRWGVEVELRGLKQTLDKHHLRCRNSSRVYVELDWSLRAQAFAELLALRAQIPRGRSAGKQEQQYDPTDRSLAATLRALRKYMRNPHQYVTADFIEA
jgi:hypothetical protein